MLNIIIEIHEIIFLRSSENIFANIVRYSISLWKSLNFYGLQKTSLYEMLYTNLPQYCEF